MVDIVADSWQIACLYCSSSRQIACRQWIVGSQLLDSLYIAYRRMVENNGTCCLQIHVQEACETCLKNGALVGCGSCACETAARLIPPSRRPFSTAMDPTPGLLKTQDPSRFPQGQNDQFLKWTVSQDFSLFSHQKILPGPLNNALKHYRVQFCN